MPKRLTSVSAIAIAIITCLWVLPTRAQQNDNLGSELFGVGVYGGYGLNLLSGEFAHNGGTECGIFEDGDGTGLLFGAIFELPLSENFRLSISPEFQDRSGTMSFPCVDPARIRLPDGTIVDALTEHKAEITNRVLSTRVQLAARLFGLPLYATAGPYLSMSFDAAFHATEEVVEPRNAEFISGGQVRDNGAGDFSGNGLSFGLAGGVRYYAPIGQRLELMPELSVSLPLDDEISDGKIRTTSIRASLGIVYRFFDDPEPVVVVEPEPVLPRLSARLIVGVNTLDGRSIGALSDTLDFYLQRTVTTSLNPLLGYVFFDHASAEIPPRYMRRTSEQIGSFDETTLEDRSVLGTYYNLLDIIGSRLRKHQQAGITITGTQPEVPSTSRVLSLARQRAEAVRGYLVDTWGINAERIAIDVRREPQSPSNAETDEGRQENRRVEIVSDDYRIIAPVLFADTTYSTVMPEITLFPLVKAEAGLNDWWVDVGFDGEVMQSFGRTHSKIRMLNWQPPSSLDLWNRVNSAIDATLTVKDDSGQVRSVARSVPVRHVHEDDRIEYGSGRYSLILFDFSSSELRPEHKKIIDLVNDRTGRNAKISVHGYTDRLGEDAFNQTLSDQRARVVAKWLKAPPAEVGGLGETAALYDNTLPEGRFYSRCVTVDVVHEQP
jgi:outer membrane protein OmpA-like peptidoglycan-associated protein